MGNILNIMLRKLKPASALIKPSHLVSAEMTACGIAWSQYVVILRTG